MKKIIIPFILVANLAALKAQTTQTRESKPFHQMEISGAANVTYSQSDTVTLKIEAHKDEIDNIITVFEEDILVIKTKGSFNHSFKVYVSGNSLSKIICSGASKLSTENILLGDSLYIDVSEAASISAKLKVNIADVMISGASAVTLEGNAETLYGSVSGASSLKAYKLNTHATIIKASGASVAKVCVNHKINASATGSSSIKFKGEPTEVSAEASSSSSIAKVADDDIDKKSGNKKDTTTINFRKKQYVIINRDKDSETNMAKKDNDDFHHWGGFGMGINGWLSNGNFGMPKGQEYMALNYGKSLNFQLNPFEKNIHLYKNYVNLVTGIGFEWNQYEFSNKTKLNADSSYTHGVIDSTNTFNYKKNRFKTTFVNIPILIELNSNKNHKKAFHVALGVVGGYKLGSRTRQIGTQNTEELRIIRKDNYNLNPFRVNAHVSVGYHNFTLYANYAITPLFENGKGPKLYPLTIGIKIVSF